MAIGSLRFGRVTLSVVKPLPFEYNDQWNFNNVAEKTDYYDTQIAPLVERSVKASPIVQQLEDLEKLDVEMTLSGKEGCKTAVDITYKTQGKNPVIVYHDPEEGVALNYANSREEQKINEAWDLRVIQENALRRINRFAQALNKHKLDALITDIVNGKITPDMAQALKRRSDTLTTYMSSTISGFHRSLAQTRAVAALLENQ